MNQSFVLGGTVFFIPGRNLLVAVADESTQLALSNPASQCLLLLIQQHGQVVERDHFFQQVWLNNGSQVTNNNFYQNISLLRRAFKEFGLNDEFIITVPKVGIRLAHELEIEHRNSAPVEFEEPAERSESVASVQKRRARRIWPVFVGAALVGGLGIFLLWLSAFDFGLQQYVLLSESGECRVYGNPDVMDHDLHQQFIQQNVLDCENYPWVYLTLYPNTQRVSQLSCRQKYSPWRENKCRMSYHIKELPHVDS